MPTNIDNCIEECVMCLASEGAWLFEDSPNVSTYDRKIVDSLGRQLSNGNPFTEKQSHIGIRLVKKYRTSLIEKGFDADRIVNEEIFKWPFRNLDKTKRLYIEGDQIVIKSPFIADVVNKLKKRKGGAQFKGNYRPDDKTWSFDYNESNLMFLYELIIGYNNFDIESKIVEDYEKCNAIRKQGEIYFPTLLGSDVTEDVRKQVLRSRLNGVLAYDDDVVDLMKQAPTKVDKIFLGDNNFWFINMMKYNILDIFPLIKSSETCIIMCASNEFRSLKIWVDTLLKNGIESKDISVCFRYKNIPEGNEYIKDQGVNEFDPNNKIFFINEKVPKPLITNNVSPDVVVYTIPTAPSHYKTRSWLDSKPLVLYYNTSIPSGVENCAEL